MLLKCPQCHTHHRPDRRSDKLITKDGRYYRKSDRKWVQRYVCHTCKHRFSSASLSDCYHQKKRHWNSKVARLLTGSVSQREAARILKLNRKTIVRKFIFMGLRAKRELENLNLKQVRSSTIQFDDVETFEHTKCKPLSITMAVEEESRRILALEVSRMPAKGLLAKISVKKYGKRKDERPQARKRLLTTLTKLVTDKVLIKTDESTHYVNDIKKFFPNSEHRRFKGRRGCVVGQGELKKIGFDPIFSLNHTAAMSRYKISRLVRRTWTTTKKPERLDLHLALWAVAHNRSLGFG